MISTKRLIAALAITLASANAHAQFANFQAKKTLPTGVTLQYQDGGLNYFLTNGYTTTAASRTWNPSALGSQPTITYSLGWDDPTFFQWGITSTNLISQPNVTTALSQRYNVALGVNTGTAGTMDLLLNNGLSLVTVWENFGQTISADRVPGFETAGIYTWDEPSNTTTAMLAPISGIPTTTFTASATANTLCGGTCSSLSVSSVSPGPILSFENGTGVHFVTTPYWNDGNVSLPTDTYVSVAGGSGFGLSGTYALQTLAGALFNGAFGSKTITQSAVTPVPDSVQGTRFLNLGLAGTTNLTFNAFNTPAGAGTLGAAMPLTFASPNGRYRHIDSVGADIFWFTQAGDQGVATVNATYSTGVFYQQHANDYCASINICSPYTQALSQKGSHYGDWITILRQYNIAGGIPTWAILEPLNANTGAAYAPQGVELNWAVWSSIIHGALGIMWFPNGQGIDQAFCGVDSLFCAALNSSQTTTVTGSIATSTCNGVAGQVLTTTGTTTGYGLFPGMTSTAGVTGGPATILQPCAPSTATANATTGGVASSSVTLSSIVGTVQVPMRIFDPTGVSSLGNNLGAVNWIVSGGPSVYNLFAGTFNISGNVAVKLQAYPGTNGTYLISQGTGTGNMSFTQPQGTNQAITSMGTLVSSLAPIIHSRFANGLVTPSPNGFQFENGMTQFCGQGGTQSLQSNTCGTTTGIETMAKLYEGPTYTASTGDVISKGFYIFADTRYREIDSNISATFNLAANCGVGRATVIGESRSINITNCSFTDTFADAWTVHIYALH